MNKARTSSDVELLPSCSSSGSVVVVLVVLVVVVWLPGGRSQERDCHVVQYEAQWIIILPFPPEFDPGLW